MINKQDEKKGKRKNELMNNYYEYIYIKKKNRNEMNWNNINYKLKNKKLWFLIIRLLIIVFKKKNFFFNRYFRIQLFLFIVLHIIHLYIYKWIKKIIYI